VAQTVAEAMESLDPTLRCILMLPDEDVLRKVRAYRGAYRKLALEA
jgi:hypothetical protein